MLSVIFTHGARGRCSIRLEPFVCDKIGDLEPTSKWKMHLETKTLSGPVMKMNFNLFMSMCPCEPETFSVVRKQTWYFFKNVR